MLELPSIPLVCNYFPEKKQLFISLQYVYWINRDLTFCSQDNDSSLEFDCSAEQGKINVKPHQTAIVQIWEIEDT